MDKEIIGQPMRQDSPSNVTLPALTVWIAGIGDCTGFDHEMGPWSNHLGRSRCAGEGIHLWQSSVKAGDRREAIECRYAGVVSEGRTNDGI